MQLPADEEIIMISGQPPIKAKKLRYFEDANFSGRVNSPPDLESARSGKNSAYQDRPPQRSDDWGEQVRGDLPTHAQTGSQFNSESDEDEGGLKRHPSLPEETPVQPEQDQAPDAGLLDEEFDTADAKRMEQLTRNASTIQRAHAMDQSDDDLMSSF
jgi:type IV secretion system protein VirD4